MPSYHEGMSNVLLEAAATGQAGHHLRYSRAAARRSMTASAAICVASGMLTACMAAMRRFVQLPAQQRAAMGAAGRALAEARFDKDKVVASTIAAMGL